MARERRDNKKRILNKGEYQNEDGRYMYRYKDVNGITRYVYSWTLTKSDRTPKGRPTGKCLRDLEKEIEIDLVEEIDSYATNRETLNDCFDRYMERKRKLKESTKSVYLDNYGRYVRSKIGNRLIAEIKYSDIYSYYDDLITKDGLNPSTVKNIQTLLNPVFRIAVRDRIIRSNPCTGIISELCKEHGWSQPKRHALTRSQQKAFLDYIKDHGGFCRWYNLMVFLLGTGCRIGEALGITWSDCDFENGVIHINHTLCIKRSKSKEGGAFYISTPKTEAGVRDIPMFEAVRKALFEERKKQLKEGLSSTSIEGYTGFVFLGCHGNPIFQNSVNAAILRIVENYNKQEAVLSDEQNREPIFLPRFSVHTLRHTFCTRLCETETNIKVIQEIMGHASISITMDIYNEATLEQKKMSFEIIENKMMIC